MAEEETHSYNEILREMANEMNQTDLDSETESVQQMVEPQPLLPSQPSISSNYLPQQYVVEDKVTIDIKESIFRDCGERILLPECCIYRVPVTLRHLKEEAYTPKFVSIGPFHYGDERLQEMERHKQVLFKRFTKRAMSSLDDMVRLVRHLEPKVRASYSHNIDIGEQELAKLALIDAGFIIQLFLMRSPYMHEAYLDAKLSQPWFLNDIQEDLLLLENQLPFFIVEELFNKAFPLDHRGSLPSFLELTYGYFSSFNNQKLKPNPDIEIKHFTNLLRLFYLQEERPEQNSFATNGRHILLYNANALQEAGIKLKATTGKCLLDLKLSGNILEIPQIWMDDATELLFRNMIALEQCHYPDDAYITDYALVLDCLIDTYKDVDLLVDKNIVSHYLGHGKNVASLINGLLKNVTHTNINSKYIDMFQKLNSYYQDPRHKMKATLRRDYCHTPWQIVASIAATVLLFLTIVQTIFSILQVALKK